MLPDAGLRRGPSASETEKVSSTRSVPLCGMSEGGNNVDEEPLRGPT
jgi:hypothetical protein